MKRFLGVVLSAALIAGPSLAQDTTSPDPVRLELARRIVDATSAKHNADAMIDQFYGMFDKVLGASGAGRNAELMATFRNDMKVELRAMMPGLLDESVKIYARNLTEKELTDLLAWQTSETGQSINQKLPRITQEILTAEIPYIQAMMPRLMQRTVERACDEVKCTPEVRQEIAGAVAKVMQKSPS